MFMNAERDALTEEIRQSHCDRKWVAHKCIGVMTAGPQGIMLDCEICGQDTGYYEGISEIVQKAKEFCAILEVDYATLSLAKKRQLLLEVAAQYANHYL